MKLHHIGIAVRSIEDAVPRYAGLGMRLDSVEEVATEKVRVAVMFAGDTRIELLEPSEPGSPVARFLEKRGPGVHHLAFEVKELDGTAVPFIEPAPRPGAHGTSVAFVHPRHLGGVLVELVEERP